MQFLALKELIQLPKFSYSLPNVPSSNKKLNFHCEWFNHHINFFKLKLLSHLKLLIKQRRIILIRLRIGCIKLTHSFLLINLESPSYNSVDLITVYHVFVARFATFQIRTYFNIIHPTRAFLQYTVTLDIVHFTVDHHLKYISSINIRNQLTCLLILRILINHYLNLLHSSVFFYFRLNGHFLDL